MLFPHQVETVARHREAELIRAVQRERLARAVRLPQEGSLRQLFQRFQSLLARQAASLEGTPSYEPVACCS